MSFVLINDRRETCNQTFDNDKVLIDYLANLWRSDYNVSHNNTVTVGFYGGEPLLNMKLIQETIAYIESLHIDNLRFSYNMTTKCHAARSIYGLFSRKGFYAFNQLGWR